MLTLFLSGHLALCSGSFSRACGCTTSATTGSGRALRPTERRTAVLGMVLRDTRRLSSTLYTHRHCYKHTIYTYSRMQSVILLGQNLPRIRLPHRVRGKLHQIQRCIGKYYYPTLIPPKRGFGTGYYLIGIYIYKHYTLTATTTT